MDYRLSQLEILIGLHNDARVNRFFFKRKPLIKNSLLMSYAQRCSNSMASRNLLLNNANKQDILGLGFDYVIQNIAYGSNSPENVMKIWMNSSYHKNNILNREVTEIGCGMSLSEHGKLFWSVCLAKRSA